MTLEKEKSVCKGRLIGIVYDTAIGVNVKHSCFDQKLLVTLIADKEVCEKAFSIILVATKAALEKAGCTAAV